LNVDSASAKKVAFDKEIKSRCVTLDGDVFDPSGTLTGGSRSQSSSILTQLQQLNESRKQLTEHKNILAQINKQLADSKTVAAKYKDAKQKFELKNHEIELLTSRLNLTSHHQVMRRVTLIFMRV
jgi:structural maintenance of chromosome 2